MPGGDGTGPLGLGPMTGRAAGYCAGYGVPGYMNPVPGRGWPAWGRGRGWGAWGRGRGWRNWYYATGLTGWQRAGLGWPAWGSGWRRFSGPAVPWTPPATPDSEAARDQELTFLRNQADSLRAALEDVQRRIEELEQARSENPGGSD